MQLPRLGGGGEELCGVVMTLKGERDRGELFENAYRDVGDSHGPDVHASWLDHCRGGVGLTAKARRRTCDDRQSTDETPRRFARSPRRVQRRLAGVQIAGQTTEVCNEGVQGGGVRTIVRTLHQLHREIFREVETDGDLTVLALSERVEERVVGVEFGFELPIDR